MNKTILSFSFLLLLFSVSFAQVAILKSTTFVDSISQPGLKKYGIKLSFDGINVPVIYETLSFPDSTYYYGDSIPNLLSSSSAFNDISNRSFTSYAKNANNTTQTILEIDGHPMYQNVLNFPLVSSSNGLNCDGIINTNIDTSRGIYYTAPYLLTYNQGVPFQAIPLQLPSSSFTLCSGMYKIFVDYDVSFDEDSFIDSTVYVSNSFGFLIGQYAFPSLTGLDVNVNTYKDATSPACDGKARVNILNSNIPFLCAFDGGSYSSSDSITNLCEGIHSVLVATANDTVGKYFIIANANSVINNSNPSGPVVDTIIYNFTNCNFNYNLPIDSAFLNNYIAIDSNTVFFSWQIWQQGVVTTVSDTMSFLYQIGYNMVSLNIFCGSARTQNTNSFKTFRINDYAYLSSTTTSITEKDTPRFKIYPNPFSNVFSIKSKDIGDIKNIEITNLLGEKMFCNYQSNGQEMNFTTDLFKAGFYTISITNRSGETSSYKIIKQ